MCKVSLLFHTLSSWETYGLRCVSFRYEESISSSSLTLKFIQTYSSLVKIPLGPCMFLCFYLQFHCMLVGTLLFFSIHCPCGVFSSACCQKKVFEGYKYPELSECEKVMKQLKLLWFWVDSILVLLLGGCLPHMSSHYWLVYYHMRKGSWERKGRG